MSSSGEVFILNKIAELASRCGINPTIADINLHLHLSERPYECYYTLGGLDGIASSPEEEKKVAKVWSLLGLDGSGFRRIETLAEAEQIVDHALSQVPRPRLR